MHVGCHPPLRASFVPILALFHLQDLRRKKHRIKVRTVYIDEIVVTIEMRTPKQVAATTMATSLKDLTMAHQSLYLQLDSTTEKPPPKPVIGSLLDLATPSLLAKMRISRCTYAYINAVVHSQPNGRHGSCVMQCLRTGKSRRNMKKMIEALKRECAALAFGLEMRAVTTSLSRTEVPPLPKALSLSRCRCYPCKVFEVFLLVYPCQSSK
ncbi:hypothetical protein B296_00056019 [Ensete ventricosum]|uniref:Uncharacterized protein n=1 Tax=Ensete ventricosum TaxID=4639 RepID=A0A426X1F8_ENSVE|nr:hypothetical protein B296_00056019 [Ensete ventricosum]